MGIRLGHILIAWVLSRCLLFVFQVPGSPRHLPNLSRISGGLNLVLSDKASAESSTIYLVTIASWGTVCALILALNQVNTSTFYSAYSRFLSI
ncbi:MAG: hypothetical protein KAV00_15120 [Phycisphaerae bacterium]|nr:hypothetical protein [Phycisphaerae bacterium]